MSRAPELRLALATDEIVIDNFAGGGGASEGIEAVLREMGRHVDIAINHDPEAIALHKANHPKAEHYTTDVFHVDIVKACRKRRVGFAWYSPDCTYHSKARGGKPFRDRNKARRIRGLAWVIVKQAKELRDAGTPIRIIGMENVQEFADWGPLDDEGKIIAIKKGLTFRRWCKQLSNLGYELDMWTLKGCDYGAPTTRERLFIVARFDGKPIAKPEPSHGKGRAKPWRTAAECIDWSIPGRSIFNRKKPLAENTMRRIHEGIRRFVINNPTPFIVPVAHAGDSRVNGVDEPLRTITADRRGDFALIEPFIAGVGGRMGQSAPRSVTRPAQTVTGKADAAIVTPVIARLGQTGGNGAYVNSVEDPLTTITTKGEHLVVAPVLVPRYGERPATETAPGQAPRCRSIQLPLPAIVTTGNEGSLIEAFLLKQNGVDEKMVVGQELDGPLHTITATDSKAIVTSNLIKLRNNCIGQDVRAPLDTITCNQKGGGHFAEVRAFLIKYYSEGGQWGDLNDPMGTITTKDRLGLVTIAGEDYQIVDITLRMLTARELYRAQGFEDDYKIEIPYNGGPLTKTAQVRMCGNSVCPPVAEAIVRAQLTEQLLEAVA